MKRILGVFLMVLFFLNISFVFAEEVENGDGDENNEAVTGEYDFNVGFGSITNSVREVGESIRAFSPKEIFKTVLKNWGTYIASNSLPFFQGMDRYLFNISGFEESPIFQEHNFVFLGVGLMILLVAWASALARAVFAGENLLVEARTATIRAGLYIATLVFFIAFVLISARVTDAIALNMINTVIGENKVIEFTQDYYKFERSELKKQNKEEEMAYSDTREKEALDGTRLSGAAVVFYIMDKSMSPENGVLTQFYFALFVGFFIFAILFFFFLYAVMRDFMITSLIIASPIFLAIPIYPTFKTLNVFKVFAKICVHHLGMIFGFCIAILWIDSVDGGGTVMYIMLPIVLFFGVFIIAHMFQSAIDTGGSLLGLHYKSGMPAFNYVKSYTKKGYHRLKQGRKVAKAQKNKQFKTDSRGRIKSYKDHPAYAETEKQRLKQYEKDEKRRREREERNYKSFRVSNYLPKRSKIVKNNNTIATKKTTGAKTEVKTIEKKPEKLKSYKDKKVVKKNSEITETKEIAKAQKRKVKPEKEKKPEKLKSYKDKNFK